MLEPFQSIDLLSSNVLDMKKIKEEIVKTNNVLYVSYNFLTDDYEDIPYDCINGLNLKLRKFGQDNVSKIVSKLDSVDGSGLELLKSILAVITNNEEMFVISEMLSHGVTHSNVIDNLKTMVTHLKHLIDCSSISDFSKSDGIIQIQLESDNLYVLLIKIIDNINKKIVLIPSLKGRGTLSSFLLVNFLHKENVCFKTKLTFILPKQSIFIGDDIVCTESWIKLNPNELDKEKQFSVNFTEKQSCFLILSQCNLFTAMVNYVNLLGGTFSMTRKVPILCLVQENVYVKFVDLLKNYLSKSSSIELLDRNRQIAVNYCENAADFTALLNAINESSNLRVLSATSPCIDYQSYYPTIVVDNCQPQQELFRDYIANKFCSFLLTFRNCQEAIGLANQIYRNRDCVYLWTESISQCFALRKQLKYRDVFVNVVQNYVMLTDEPNFKYKCKGSFFSKTNPTNDVAVLTANEISSKIMELKSISKWSNESFFRRYSCVINVINKMTKSGMLSNDGGHLLTEYLENRVKPFQFSYLIRDSLNKLTESFPIGCVVIDFGECDVSDIVVQTMLLVWLFGNDVAVVSVNDMSLVFQSFTEVGKPTNLTFIKGRLSLPVIGQCSFIDSVLCFDESLATQHGSILTADFHSRVLYKDLDSMTGSNEEFDDIVSFVREEKSLYILSGDVGIS